MNKNVSDRKRGTDGKSIPLGAELQSIYDKRMEKEVLWQGDKKYWGRRAPVLFPNVGRHSGDFYLWKGKRFDTKQHGFARDMEFTCVLEKDDELVFSLKDTEKTREYFPFAFELKIGYTLSGRALQVKWEVKNQGQETMYFTIGGHPAFRVPVLENTVQTDYKLLFEVPDRLEYKLICPGEGTADPSSSYPLILKKYGEYYGCDIEAHMFDKDALLFDEGQVQWAALDTRTEHLMFPWSAGILQTSVSGQFRAPPLSAWSRWMGRCDDHDFSGEISQKPGILKLGPSDTFRKSYKIRVFER